LGSFREIYFRADSPGRACFEKSSVSVADFPQLPDNTGNGLCKKGLIREFHHRGNGLQSLALKKGWRSQQIPPNSLTTEAMGFAKKVRTRK